tara:strand:+ start:216 stop:524 length:309 start_codon:yes stop_codon:yes gene_type:complete
MPLSEKIELSKIDSNKGYFFESDVFKDEILVYFNDGNFFAVSSFCPHFGGPLELTSKDIRCYWHGWRFDLKSQKCINRDVNCRLKNYRVEIQDNFIEIFYGD